MRGIFRGAKYFPGYKTYIFFQALLPYLAWVSLPYITRLHKTRLRRSTNIPSQKRRKRNKNLLLSELNEAETEVKKSHKMASCLRRKLSKHRARRVQRPQAFPRAPVRGQIETPGKFLYPIAWKSPRGSGAPNLDRARKDQIEFPGTASSECRTPGARIMSWRRRWGEGSQNKAL